MMFRPVFLGILCAALLSAAKHPQKIATTEAADTAVSVVATVYSGPEPVKQILGNDLQGHYIVVQVQLTPHGGELPVQLDDFLLKTDKDGERTHPFVPSQIAGEGALVISTTYSGGGVGGGDPTGPVWGGLPGTGSRPQQMPGNGGGLGNTSSLEGSKATMTGGGKDGDADKKNPLLDVLTAKMLPEKPASKTVSGLLYFPMEKQKVKDLELIYTSPAGKLNLHFK